VPKKLKSCPGWTGEDYRKIITVSIDEAADESSASGITTTPFSMPLPAIFKPKTFYSELRVCQDVVYSGNGTPTFMH